MLEVWSLVGIFEKVEMVIQDLIDVQLGTIFSRGKTDDEIRIENAIFRLEYMGIHLDNDSLEQALTTGSLNMRLSTHHYARHPYAS